MTNSLAALTTLAALDGQRTQPSTVLLPHLLTPPTILCHTSSPLIDHELPAHMVSCHVTPSGGSHTPPHIHDHHPFLPWAPERSNIECCSTVLLPKNLMTYYHPLHLWFSFVISDIHILLLPVTQTYVRSIQHIMKTTF